MLRSAQSRFFVEVIWFDRCSITTHQEPQGALSNTIGHLVTDTWRNELLWVFNSQDDIIKAVESNLILEV